MGGLTIQVRVEGGEALASSDAAALVRQIGQALAQQMGEAVHAASAPHVPVDTGTLLGSGEVVLTSDGGAALQYVTPYARDVEEGTPPHVVPVSELQGWAERHGIPAHVVQQAIELRGTKAQPYMEPGLAEAQGSFDGMAQDAGARLAAAFGEGGA